jgi:cytochrome c-type biogenesis protein CcmF
VLLGTLYPLFLDALGLGKISVGPPYFDAVFAPIMAPLVFLMGVGPIARWKEARIPDLWALLRWTLGVAIAAALVAPLIGGKWTPLLSFGLFLAFWVVAATFVTIRQQVRHAQDGVLAGLRRQPRAFWGMTLAHLGIAVFIVGVTLVKGFETERDVRMAVGDSIEVGGYAFRFEGVAERAGPNFMAMRGTFDVSKNSRHVEKLYPEKRAYFSQPNAMTEAAIDTGVFGDLYVSLGEPVGEGAWTVRVYSKPFVTWIWGGCVLMALGGLLAILDRRYRLAQRREQVLPTGAGAAAD